jgi:hypothetical protein
VVWLSLKHYCGRHEHLITGGNAGMFICYFIVCRDDSYQYELISHYLAQTTTRADAMLRMPGIKSRELP